MTKAVSSPTSHTLVPRIEGRIQVIRNRRVMIDADLAALYGVPTKALNQAVKRNLGRFPADFMFPLTPLEKQGVVTNCDHLSSLKFSKTLPYAFTEHGAIQAANVLASDQAVEMGIYVVRAFMQLREALSANADLDKRLASLQKRTEQLEHSHEALSQATRMQLRHLLDAVRELTMPIHPPKRPIGFVPPEDKSKAGKAIRPAKQS